MTNPTLTFGPADLAPRARIREAARLKAEERAGLAERLLEQEVRLRGS